MDTEKELRVFEWCYEIWKVKAGDGIGRKAGGGFSAANYSYVLLRCRCNSFIYLPTRTRANGLNRTYTPTNHPTLGIRFSFVSLDRKTAPG